MDTPTPIAIVGIGCRFPGGADSADKLWELLASGNTTWSPVPANRWNDAAFFDSDPDQQGMQNSRGGHFLDQDISAFDGTFWGLAPAECEAIDPQHRIQLEVAYEALENAGLRLQDVEGSDTAVYVATFSQDYKLMHLKDMDDIPKYHITGTGTAVAANRISYQMDLRGPSVTIDTGCSGSLVAIHQACQSLRTGECRMALAGGVNLILTPDQMTTMSLMRCFSEDGKCYSFDSRGTGYGRGEGAAMVALKRLDDAIRDGDPIRAVIRNTGVNQDGKTNGIMVPKSEAQKELIESVYHGARLDPKDTSVVEAHGTGTAVGDPLEVAAIRGAFRNQESDRPLYVGSIKPNIGHLESASGIAGLIKGILMLERGKIPATIGVESLKPNLRLKEFSIEIPGVMSDWPLGTPRRLSLNNFGYGGTNAHAILEAAAVVSQSKVPTGISKATSNGFVNGSVDRNSNGIFNGEGDAHYSERLDSTDPQIVSVSAKSADSLMQAVKDLRDWSLVQAQSDELLEDLAHTLSSHRSLMQHRVAFSVRTLQDLISRIDSVISTPTKSSPSPRLLFVFTGQGAQWYAMGRELVRVDSPFRASVLRSDDILHSFGAGWSLLDELSKAESETRVNESEVAQPATTALQLALLDLLSDVGVSPNIVVGHSSGEIAAAYAAGALDQVSALRVAYFRGRLTRQNSWQKGAMLAVGLGEAEVTRYLRFSRSGKAVIACANSPSSSTISGDEAAVGEIETALRNDGVFARRLAVDRAYHSHHMQEAAEQYLRDLAGLQHQDSKKDVTFISSVTGENKSTAFGPRYWMENLVSKVRFADAVNRALRMEATMPKTSHLLIVETGPHNALAGPVRQVISHGTSTSTTTQHATLLRRQDALETFGTLAAELFVQGCSVDLARLNTLFRPTRRRKVLTSLPSYAWNHSMRHWHESWLSKEYRFRKHPYHDLLGVQIPGSGSPRPAWRHIVSISRLPWLREHIIDGEIIFPASGYVCMVLEAMRQFCGDRKLSGNISKYMLRDVVFVAPLVIPESGTFVELQLRLVPVDGSQWDDFRIYGVDKNGTSTEHCHGSVMAILEPNHDEVEGSRELVSNQASLTTAFWGIRSMDLDSIDTSSFYQGLRDRGNVYGPHFACMKELYVNDEHALGKFVIPDVAQCMPAAKMREHLIHPAVVDAFLHPSVAIFDRSHARKSMVTAAIDSLSISASILNNSGITLESWTRLADQWNRTCTSDVNVFQPNAIGNLDAVVQIRGLRLQALQMIGGASGSASSEFNPYLGETEEVSVAQAHKLQTLNQASALYIDRCLKQMELAKGAAVSDNHQRLLKWMRRFRNSKEYSNLLSSSPDCSDEVLLKMSRTMGVEGEILARIGENLASIMISAMDPLSLITEQDLLWRLYADDASVRCYGFAIEYLQHLVFKNPKMAVLELGAGTGGATEPILDALSLDREFPFLSYDFTDVSAAFFERSKQRLQRWEGKISYRKLDLQQDAIEQGFHERSYDLVLASNVLHVAHSIDDTLSRIQKLLKPGGRVLMIETTKNVPFLNTAIGVLPGWWGAEDGRIDGPLLSEAQWDVSLARNGLGGAAIVAKDFEGPAHRCAMIVSKPLVFNQISYRIDAHVKILLSPLWRDCSPAVLGNLTSALREKYRTVTVGSLQKKESSQDTLYIVVDNGSSPALLSEDGTLFKSITYLVSSPVSLLWISVQEDPSSADNPEKGLIAGFARVARVENRSLRLTTLDVQDSTADVETQRAVAEAVAKLADSIRAGRHTNQPIEQDCIFRNGQLCIPRVLPDRRMNVCVAQALGTLPLALQPFHQPDRPLRLCLDRARTLDEAEFIEDDSLDGGLAPADLEISVQACGVNFKDMLIAGGHVKKKLEMAGEFAGIVIGVGAELNGQYEVGDRVCGFGATPYANRVRVRGITVGRVPTKMSLATAASIPVVFATAYYALVDRANLEKGQTVLIHSAAGGVGQAAVTIAQWIGAEIFVTVGNASKKEFLVKELGIPEDHIFSSRLSTFKDGISRLTDGKGVDVVLNSLSGQMLQDSLECVAKFGTFVELGKTDAHLGTRVSMAPFDGSIMFASVDLSMINEHKPGKAGQLIQGALTLVANKDLQCPSLSVLPIEKLGDAFRMMQNRSHIGKIVLDAGDDSKVKAPIRKERINLVENGTIVVAGGRGGLGYEIAKYLAKNGAKHILLLSRRPVETAEEARGREIFKDLGAEVCFLSCDITHGQEVQERLTRRLANMPPVRGVIQATMVRQDGILCDMERNDFRSCISPKVEGTQNLIVALKDQPLHFFLMLSSIVGGIIGSLAEANYAAGNAYLNWVVNSKRNSSTRFIAVCPGVIEDVGVVAGDEKAKKILERQGFLSMKSQEVIALVHYALSEEASRRGCNEIISGFDYQSLLQSGQVDALENPLFSHLPRSQTSQLVSCVGKSSETIDTSIASTKTREEAEAVVIRAIVQKVGTLVAIGENEIDPDRSVAELGIDSLVVVELKNWIAQTFQAKVHNLEISDAPNITHLAGLVAAKSPQVAQKPSSIVTSQSPAQGPVAINDGQDATETSESDSEEPMLPKQPLPDLDSSLELWLTAVRPVLTDTEYAKAMELVDKFRTPGGQGRKLQARLAALACDPGVDNWQEDLYNRFHHLKLREPLMPQLNFCGTHFNPRVHSAAERAAIICIACHNFSRRLENGELDHEVIREQRMDKNQYQWFFNTTREPRKGEDVLRKYPGNDYLVAFRHGRAFRIRLDVPIAAIKARFQEIIDKSAETESWVGVLTTDDRDVWTDNRKRLLEASPANEEWLHTIEAAAFVIYLDDAKPESARARGYQFLHADGFNRWCDKTVQFVVCDNGWSATIGEHSMIDGYTMRRLNAAVQEAIGTLTIGDHQIGISGTLPALESFAFDTTPEIERHIASAREGLRKRTSVNELAAFQIQSVGVDFFRRHRVPAKSGMQLAIQLASKKYFGFNPIGHETVTLAHFLKGRVECSHTLWPAVKKFCDAASVPNTPNETLRDLFYDAAKEHASNLMRCSRGQGIDRHLLCLEWSVREGEPLPELFSSELYKASRPRMLMTDCLETGVLECGALPPRAGGLWVHFEPDSDQVRFSVWGPSGDMDRFEQYMKESVEMVRDILET